MPYVKMDKAFVEDFKSKYLAHLKATYDPKAGENQAQDIVKKAVSEESIGRISRIFDALKVDVAKYSKVKRRLKRSGNVESYLAPILNDLANILLIEDRSRVTDEVIDAIGKEAYVSLTAGSRVKEKEFAEMLLKATVVLYNGALTDKLVEAITKQTMTPGALNKYKSDLTDEFMTPAGILISNFSMDTVLKAEDTIKQNSEKEITIKKLKHQVNRYRKFLNSLLGDTTGMAADEITALKASVDSALPHVENAKSVYDMHKEDPTMMPLEAAKSIMATNLTQSMEAFVNKVDPASLKVKPSKTYTDILSSAISFFAKLHAICTGAVSKDKVRVRKEEAFLAKMKDLRSQIAELDNNTVVESEEKSSTISSIDDELYGESTFKAWSNSSMALFREAPSPVTVTGVDLLEVDNLEKEEIERAFTGTISI